MDQKLLGYHPVFCVFGDFGEEREDETLLGIFSTRGEAEINAKDCGFINTGGDGRVEKRLAVFDEESGDYHILAKLPALPLNKMQKSKAKGYELNEKNERRAWKLKASMMFQNGQVADAVNLIRQKTELGIKFAHDLLKDDKKLDEWGESV